MNWANTIAVLLVAFVAVFFESYWSGLRNVLGAQIDLLPSLVVYASLSAGLLPITLLSVCGGLWFDSLSANPLGISVMPLFWIGLIIYLSRDLILRNQTYAQFVVGAAASAAAPLLALVLLIGARQDPLLSWGSLWQWFVMALAGGVFTPICFRLFDRLNRAFNYQPVPESSFRPDREIKRGRF